MTKDRSSNYTKPGSELEFKTFFHYIKLLLNYEASNHEFLKFCFGMVTIKIIKRNSEEVQIFVFPSNVIQNKPQHYFRKITQVFR